MVCDGRQRMAGGTEVQSGKGRDKTGGRSFVSEDDKNL